MERPPQSEQGREEEISLEKRKKSWAMLRNTVMAGMIALGSYMSKKFKK